MERNIADMDCILQGQLMNFYQYRFGKLEYRLLLCLKKKNPDYSNYQGNAVINYNGTEYLGTQGLLSINILNVLEMK